MGDTATGYARLFESFALDDTVAQRDLGETIRLPVDADPASSLPVLDIVTDREATGAQLRLGRTLGEGGMGLIRQATQMPIGREVAVKTVRAGHTANETVGRALLREAFVAGRLEHPNVVPIYAVGQDADGLPVIVMKRIEGAEWSAFLHGDVEAPTADSLGWHLGIFQTVCTAVQFAHTHGILHRDIKPDNVMIGELGEVYLVDWGLAVTLERDPTGRLPWVRERGQVCGTPHYMAPEMAANDPEGQDERTDVYLLGAVLHEIVTGAPRHQGKGLYEVMLQAYQSEPFDFDDSVPAELADICNRATRRDADERFPTALALRDAVRRFLDHRTANRLSRDADEQLSALEEALSDETRDVDERRIAVYRLYGAARFGFEQSLEAWPDNQEALDGLQRTLVAMIEWELSNGSVHAAAALLADLPEARTDLAARVREAERLAEARAKELEDLRNFRRDRDVAVGSRTRSAGTMLFLVAGLLGPAVLDVTGVIDPVSSAVERLVIAVALMLGVSVGSAFVWRGIGPWEIEHTKMNANLVLSVVAMCVFLVLFRIAGLHLGFEAATQFGLELLSFAMFAAVIALFFDRRLAGAVPAYLVSAVAVFAFPGDALAAFLVGNCAALGWLWWVWRQQSE